METILQQILNGLVAGSIYALVALGYTMVYGVMKLINFAHSEVFMVGTWTVLGVYTLLGVSAGAGLGALAIATAVCSGWRAGWRIAISSSSGSCR